MDLSRKKISLAVCGLVLVLSVVLVTSSGLRSTRVRYAFRKAEALCEQARFQEGALLYEELVRRYPASDEARRAVYRLGGVYDKLGKPVEAAGWYERYLVQPSRSRSWIAMAANVPVRGQVLIRLAGLKLESLQDARGAADNLEEYVKLFPRSQYARDCQYLIGVINERYLEDKRSALNAYGSVLTLPGEPFSDRFSSRPSMLQVMGVPDDTVTAARAKVAALRSEGGH